MDKFYVKGDFVCGVNQEKLLFSAPSLLVHFRESLHEINNESLLYEKPFGRALVEFSRESALKALPNKVPNMALVPCGHGLCVSNNICHANDSEFYILNIN